MLRDILLIYLDIKSPHPKCHSLEKILAQTIPLLLSWEIWLLRIDRRHSDKGLSFPTIANKVSLWLQGINSLIFPTSAINFFGSIILNSLQIPIKEIIIQQPRLVLWTPSSMTQKHRWSLKRQSRSSWWGGVIRDRDNNMVFAFFEALGVSNNYA